MTKKTLCVRAWCLVYSVWFEAEIRVFIVHVNVSCVSIDCIQEIERYAIYYSCNWTIGDNQFKQQLEIEFISFVC